MKYAFTTLSILSIWISLILTIILLDYEGLLLPIIAILMTIFLYEIGFGGKK